jgi:glycosyltransferase involved in cell wall biosynthesis
LDIEGRVRRIGFHVFETESYPIKWFEHAIEMDEIWTASTFNKQTFEAAGIPGFMIGVVPHCLDVDLYGGKHSPMKVSGAQGFKFLTVLSNYNRRDIGLLLRAYWAAFKGDSNVTLLIKCTQRKSGVQYNEDFISSLLPEMDLDDTSLPKYIFIKDNLSDERMRSLYSACDVYVSIDRGKGWDLPAMEAMAMGKPVISINWSGSTEFMNKDNSILIDPLPENAPVDRELVTNVADYIGHKWARVKDEAMQNALMQVYSDKKGKERIGENAQQSIGEKFNFQAVGEIIKKKIEGYKPYHFYINGQSQVVLRPSTASKTSMKMNTTQLNPEKDKIVSNIISDEDLRLILMVIAAGENAIKRYAYINIYQNKLFEAFRRLKLDECQDRKLVQHANEFFFTSLKRVNRRRKKFDLLYYQARKIYDMWINGEINIASIGITAKKAPKKVLLESYVEGTSVGEWLKRRKKLFSRYGSIPPEANEVTRLKSLKNKFLNKRIFIIGNGPSLNKIDFSKLKNEYTFGVNKIYLMSERIDWHPTFYTSIDWRVVPDDYKNINSLGNGTTFFFPNRFRGLLREGTDVYWYFSRGGGKSLYDKFEKDITKGVAGRGTVLVPAIQIAFYFGFREIYLIGVDANFVISKNVIQSGRDRFGTGVKLELTSTHDDDPNHFDPRYFGAGAKWHDPNVDEIFRGFIGCRKGVELHGGKLLNATIGGKLDVLPRVDFDSLF